MDFNIKDLQFFPIHEIKPEYWFRSIQPNDFTPTPEQRREMIRIIDERVKINSEGLNIVYNNFKLSKQGSPEYQKINHALNNLFFYIYQTTSDCMVASKNYLLADQDYDKRYARGKLRVILNEGFKNLYGFPQTKKSKTYWGELSTIMNHFPGCHFRIWVDSDLSLSLIQVDSGLTLLLVKVDFRPYPCFWLFPQVLSRSGVDWRA